MNVIVLTLSILSGVVLSGTAISLFAVHRAHRMLRELKNWKPAEATPVIAELATLRTTLDALAVQVHDLQSHPPVALAPGLPKPGLNLNKRSQALRMHRRGEAADQIAAALELPRQEVDLLIKVHRVVLSTV